MILFQTTGFAQFYVNFVNLHSSTGTVEIFMLTGKNTDDSKAFSFRAVEKPVDSVENLCGKLVIFCYTLRLCKQFVPFQQQIPPCAVPDAHTPKKIPGREPLPGTRAVDNPVSMTTGIPTPRILEVIASQSEDWRGNPHLWENAVSMTEGFPYLEFPVSDRPHSTERHKTGNGFIRSANDNFRLRNA